MLQMWITNRTVPETKEDLKLLDKSPEREITFHVSNRQISEIYEEKIRERGLRCEFEYKLVHGVAKAHDSGWKNFTVLQSYFTSDHMAGIREYVMFICWQLPPLCGKALGKAMRKAFIESIQALVPVPQPPEELTFFLNHIYTKMRKTSGNHLDSFLPVIRVLPSLNLGSFFP